jgi:hypothetical protein
MLVDDNTSDEQPLDLVQTYLNIIGSGGRGILGGHLWLQERQILFREAMSGWEGKGIDLSHQHQIY